MAGAASDIALTSFAGSAMANPNRQRDAPLRKMADGIFRTHAEYSITALLQFDDEPPYSAASPVAAAASASLM